MRSGYRPGMHRGLRTEVPLPNFAVSNEEFPPLLQTAVQREGRIDTGRAGVWPQQTGVSRRDFLRTSGGIWASFLAMNAVFSVFST
jgi:hypothetical protein